MLGLVGRGRVLVIFCLFSMPNFLPPPPKLTPKQWVPLDPPPPWGGCVVTPSPDLQKALPAMGSLFYQAMNIATTKSLVFINGDILLPPVMGDLMMCVNNATDRFLLLSHRCVVRWANTREKSWIPHEVMSQIKANQHEFPKLSTNDHTQP